jgi:hypothetical protein
MGRTEWFRMRAQAIGLEGSPRELDHRERFHPKEGNRTALDTRRMDHGCAATPLGSELHPFCLLFRIASFTVFEWISLLH